MSTQHETIVLFDGDRLDNWTSEKGGPAQWHVEGGVMTVTRDDIMTDETFDDAVLHIEFRTPYMPEATGQQRGNSGVFLQGRYEIQVLDSYQINIPGKGDCGAFYNMHAPLVNACKTPLEWQSYDVYFRAPRADDSGNITEAARATVLQNNILVQNNVELPRPTANRMRNGVDPDLSKPGPLVLQCHGQGDEVSYRNIWIQRLPLEGSGQYEPK